MPKPSSCGSQTLQAAQDEPAHMVAAATDAVRSFAGGTLADDLTLVALQRRTVDDRAERSQRENGPASRLPTAESQPTSR